MTEPASNIIKPAIKMSKHVLSKNKPALNKIKKPDLSMTKPTLSKTGLIWAVLDRFSPVGRVGPPPGEGFINPMDVTTDLNRSPGGRLTPPPGDGNEYKRWGPLPDSLVDRKPPREVDLQQIGIQYV